VLPLFLFTPDQERAHPLREAVGHGLASIGATLRRLPDNRDVAAFLLANMIYADGLVGMFAFGGIYAAGTFGWGTIQIGMFGILLTMTGALGAWLGGELDDRLGPKPVILGSLLMLILAAIAILSTGRDHVLFWLAVAPPVPGAIYSGTAEKFFVFIGLVIGLVAGPLGAAQWEDQPGGADRGRPLGLLLHGALARPDRRGDPAGYFADDAARKSRAAVQSGDDGGRERA